MSVHVVILAAGEGTRMKAGRPKVLQEVAGKAMVSWVVEAAASLTPSRTMVVVGHEAEAVVSALPEGIDTVLQTEQLGTAHATRLAVAALDPAADDVIVVLPGDTPLITNATLAALVAGHGDRGATVVTTRLADPTGYGRILRTEGEVTAVVEHLDATDEQLAIDEVATAIYAFTAGPLRVALDQVESDNVQGEQYLPDVIGLMLEAGHRVGGMAVPPGEVAGVNSFDQLAEAAEVMRTRINQDWMRQGVMMVDPARTYIDAGVLLSAGAVVYPGTHIEGTSTVGAGARVGPDTHVTDSHIGEDARVRYSVLEGADVRARAQVGPYAFLRPGTVLGPESKAGTHVEIKNSTLETGAKVPHLSYIGDATIGEEANIGAGTITCNWDGYDKHRTTIGPRARIGSDTMLVAPVEIGEEAWTGAGSVISKDVPPGSLAVERTSQREIPGYAEKRRERAESEE